MFCCGPSRHPRAGNALVMFCHFVLHAITSHILVYVTFFDNQDCRLTKGSCVLLAVVWGLLPYVFCLVLSVMYSTYARTYVRCLLFQSMTCTISAYVTSVFYPATSNHSISHAFFFFVPPSSCLPCRGGGGSSLVSKAAR